jgi:hypothetical protein
VAVDSNRAAWTASAEAAIRALRDVEDVRIQTEGDGVREIHVVTSSRRPAKQIVRDIQTVLVTRFDRTIDHRVVSVAFTDSTPEPALIPRAAPAPAPAIELHTNPEPSEPPDDRVRFGSVNLFVSGARAQAQVELRWKGVPRTGSASGWSSRDGALRLIATATLLAVQEFVDEEIGLGLAEVELVRMGRQEVAVVGLTLLAHRQEKLLVGSCTVEQDAQQAVALATLAGLNRVLGGLRTKEPTEYVLRPSSAQEASGAKRS